MLNCELPWPKKLAFIPYKKWWGVAILQLIGSSSNSSKLREAGVNHHKSSISSWVVWAYTALKALSTRSGSGGGNFLIGYSSKLKVAGRITINPRFLVGWLLWPHTTLKPFHIAEAMVGMEIFSLMAGYVKYIVVGGLVSQEREWVCWYKRAWNSAAKIIQLHNAVHRRHSRIQTSV